MSEHRSRGGLKWSSRQPDGELGAYDKGFTGWPDADEGIAAPTLITVGDCDMVTLEHAVRFLRLRGGDVNDDFAGVPASQLAVFPGITHFYGLSHTALVLDVVTNFLDGPAAASRPRPGLAVESWTARLVRSSSMALG